MPAEIEAKFRADGIAQLESLAADSHLADATLGAPRTVRVVDRYLDTADGRLAAVGWACRLRAREATVRVSLKGADITGGAEWLHERTELEGPATHSLDPAEWPAGEARDVLVGLTGGGRLRERFRLDQDRTERSVIIDGRPLGTLSLDVVAIVAAERGYGEVFAVELELDPAVDADTATGLARVADALGARPGLHADPLTKLEHALERIGRP